MTARSYLDPDGARHEVAVCRTAADDWQVLDTCAGATRVVETLDGPEDGRPQAEAVACDYLTTVKRFLPAARPEAGEPVPEQGGADAPSDDRPPSGAPSRRGGGSAVSRPAG